MVKNVNRTARLQWKLDTIKKCIYLQCIPIFEKRPFCKFLLNTEICQNRINYQQLCFLFWYLLCKEMWNVQRNELQIVKSNKSLENF